MEPLYEITVKYTYYELKRYSEYFTKINHIWFRLTAVPVIVAVIGLVLYLSGLPDVGVVMILGALLGYAALIIKRQISTTREIEVSPRLDKDITVKFYADRITTDLEKNHAEYDNNTIQKIGETEENFYIFIKQHGVIIITKQNCSAELAAYITSLKRSVSNEDNGSRLRRQ